MLNDGVCSYRIVSPPRNSTKAGTRKSGWLSAWSDRDLHPFSLLLAARSFIHSFIHSIGGITRQGGITFDHRGSRIHPQICHPLGT